MMEDGSAIINEQESLIDTTFDMNLAEVLDEDKLQVIANDFYETRLKKIKHQDKTGKKHIKKV